MANEVPTPDEAVDYSSIDYKTLDASGIKSTYESLRSEIDSLSAQIEARKTLGEVVPVTDTSKLRVLIEQGNRAVEAYREAIRPVGEVTDLPSASQRDPGRPPESGTAEEPAEAPAEEPAATPAEVPAEAPAETPAEAPAETTPVGTRERELVSASAPVSAVPEGSSVLQPFEAFSEDGTRIRTFEDMQRAFMHAAQGAKRETVLASFNPFGTDESRRLTSDPVANYRTMYGREGISTGESSRDRVRRASFGGRTPERMSFTAALNCAGPAQPVQDIPFCFNDNRPLSDSGLVAEFEAVHGQVQLYDCATLPDPIVLEPAGDCGDEDGTPCGECPPLTGCFELSCLEPGEVHEPERYVTCMCVPESIRWSNPLAFEHAMISFASAHAQAWEVWLLEAIRAVSIVRTVDGSIKPQHGAFNTIRRAVINAIAQKRLGARAACDIENYSLFIPGGEELFYASMADQMSRVLGCECPGEDLVDMLSRLVGGDVVFGEDRDPNSPATAEFPFIWDPATVELGVAAPLEPQPNAGSIYLIPRDAIGTATLPATEIGLDNTDSCSVHTGCLKMVRSEWRLPPFKASCDIPVVLDFTALCLEGSGPALQDAVCP